MKLPSGKRLGQSGQQLTTAVLFSFFLHAILLLTVLFFHFAIWPRIDVPPFYAVKLVGLPPDATLPAQTQSGPAPPAAQKQQAKPAPAKPKARKRADPSPKTARRDALTDLVPSSKKKASEAEQEAPSQQHQTAAAAPSGDQPNAAQNQGVVIGTGQQELDSKFAYYRRTLSGKILPNWKPLTGSKNMRAHILFTINRSGTLIRIKLDEEQSIVNHDFKLAALRAIQVSSPFPPLPEDYPKQTMDLSVDLTPKD